jgi:hypothetical protein
MIFMFNFFQHLAFDAVIQIITVLRAADNVKEYWRKRAQVNNDLQEFSTRGKPLARNSFLPQSRIDPLFQRPHFMHACI